MSHALDSYTFLDGWVALSDELRLRILTELFKRDHAINYKEYAKILDSALHPLLQTKYAGIAIEALYRDNTFKISTDSKKFPPKSHNGWIRHIEIDMTIDQDYSDWPFLRKMCTGAFGFRHLNQIDITFIPGKHDTFNKMDLTKIPLIVPTVKKLSVKFNYIAPKAVTISMMNDYLDDYWKLFHPVVFKRISLQDFLPQDASGRPNGLFSSRYIVSPGKECTWDQIPGIPNTQRKGCVLLGLTTTRVQPE